MVYAYRRLKGKNSEEIREKRFSLVKAHLDYAYKNSTYYRKLFDSHKIDVHKIKCLEDVSKIPVTKKDDLRNHNEEFYAASKSKCIDLASTSGTTGRPVYMPMTRNDLIRTARGGAQTLLLSGIERKDVVHLALPMGAWMWMAGYGFFLCFTTLGAQVLRFGPGFTEKSVQTMKELGATVLMANPSFALKLGETARKLGIKTGIKRIFTVGESVLGPDLRKNVLGKKIEEVWSASLFSCYGTTEGPMVAVECNQFKGHHVNPYEVYVEILNPDTLRPVEPGETGLVAITPLGVEGFPLVRYLNGDLSYILPGRCGCGRMLDVMGPVLARNDQMMKIKGVLVYPESIKEVITEIDSQMCFQIEVFTQGCQDSAKILVPKSENSKTAVILQETIHKRLGFSIPVEEIDKRTLDERIMPPGTRKPTFFVDNRDRSLII